VWPFFRYKKTKRVEKRPKLANLGSKGQTGNPGTMIAKFTKIKYHAQ